VQDAQDLVELILRLVAGEPESVIRDHLQGHAEPVASAVEPGEMLSVDGVQPQRGQLVLAGPALDGVELSELVPDDTSATAADRPLLQSFDLLGSGSVYVTWCHGANALLPREQQGREITTVGGAETPRRRGGIHGEDLPGDVPGRLRGRLVNVTRRQGLGRDGLAGSRIIELHGHSRGVGPLGTVPAGVLLRRLHPHAELDLARVRPQHAEEPDDRAGQARPADAAALGDRGESGRPAAAGENGRRAHLHRGQPEGDLGRQQVMTLPVGQAIDAGPRLAIRPYARLAVAELGRVELRRLPVQGPGLERPVAEHQQNDDDHPPGPAGAGNQGAQAERVKERVADRVGAPRKRALEVGGRRTALR
jgi:hypothetical protein